jgi:hypothetical protein
MYYWVSCSLCIRALPRPRGADADRAAVRNKRVTEAPPRHARKGRRRRRRSSRGGRDRSRAEGGDNLGCRSRRGGGRVGDRRGGGLGDRGEGDGLRDRSSDKGSNDKGGGGFGRFGARGCGGLGARGAVKTHQRVQRAPGQSAVGLCRRLLSGGIAVARRNKPGHAARTRTLARRLVRGHPLPFSRHRSLIVHRRVDMYNKTRNAGYNQGVVAAVVRALLAAPNAGDPAPTAVNKLTDAAGRCTLGTGAIGGGMVFACAAS